MRGGSIDRVRKGKQNRQFLDLWRCWNGRKEKRRGRQRRECGERQLKLKVRKKRLTSLEKNSGCPGDEEGSDNGPFSQNSLLNISGHICRDVFYF